MRALGVVLLLVFLLFPLGAGDGFPVEISPYPTLWGAGATITWRLFPLYRALVHPSLFLGADAAWATDGAYYRLPDGSVYTGEGASSPPGDTGYHYLQTRWRFGITQAFLATRTHDYVGITVEYAGLWRDHLDRRDTDQLLFLSGLPERDGALQHELRARVFVDYVETHPVHGYEQGVWAGVWYRAVPPGWGSTPTGERLSFSGVGGEVRGYLPLWDRDPQVNATSLLAAFLLTGEKVWGDAVPFYEKGTRLEYLRGVDGAGLDTLTSWAADLELRWYLPPVGEVLEGILWPVVVAFVDTGFFWDETPSGATVVADTGMGFFLDFTPYFQLGVTTQWRLLGTNVDGSVWTPFGMSFGYLY
ncbi:hypothetical protein Spith_1960 [Spirochaeta thermophila DSM 6578]|uniref:Bacterial surface antigen (D15) domain-containing protein n=1 Tax=Winmispira thermophila (strain ATCC 700085 / DSM 6578 / Z-1203) TaxID=869211 RepID=G0GDT8_WINT7|nr:hypothetical protein [Spirochaeta thermophila]AEJ62218.1 hypothetical protein Spith_1960 [Spirochaeta thermophila DSM 6578]